MSAADAAGWAPADPSDGRKRWDWPSKWDEPARTAMRKEAAFLTATAVIALAAAVTGSLWLHPDSPTLTLDTFFLASFGAGLIGGVTFGFKWFYHVIARGLWHLDRRYWRCMAPYISAVLAVVVALTLLRADLVAGKGRMEVVIETLIVSFLAGYFSDGALAKLAEVAQVVFGKSEEHKPQDVYRPAPTKSTDGALEPGAGKSNKHGTHEEAAHSHLPGDSSGLSGPGQLAKSD